MTQIIEDYEKLQERVENEIEAIKSIAVTEGTLIDAGIDVQETEEE